MLRIKARRVVSAWLGRLGISPDELPYEVFVRGVRIDLVFRLEVIG